MRLKNLPRRTLKYFEYKRVKYPCNKCLVAAICTKTGETACDDLYIYYSRQTLIKEYKRELWEIWAYAKNNSNELFNNILQWIAIASFLVLYTVLFYVIGKSLIIAYMR